jgi:hypothetical protein
MTEPTARFETILVVGEHGPFSVPQTFCRSLTRLGRMVHAFDVTPYYGAGGRFVAWVRDRLASGPIVNQLNEDLLATVKALRPHCVLIDKGRFVKASTVRAIRTRGISCVHVTLDDAFESQGKPTWRHVHQAIPAYSSILYPSARHVEDYVRHGAADVIRLPFFFEPSIHYRPSPMPDPDIDVVFIGSPFDQRAAILLSLARDYGIQVRIFGPRWDRVLSRREREILDPGPEQRGDNYRQVIARSRICLGFNTLMHRHDSAHRWPEIAACGGFLLAARTSEATDWFKPEIEASFFDDIADCADKIRYWLAHESARQAVAEAGYVRAQGQMNIDQSMAQILAHLERLHGE